MPEKFKPKPKTLHSFFSNETNLFYRLFQASENDLPCLEISGIRMHCYKNSSILETTKAMVSTLKPLNGIVLDTCCGLGYTAIEIAQSSDVKKVFTFEIDSNVLELAKNNPSSKGLFSNKKIELIEGDAVEKIFQFKENYFDAILHDPPSISIAGELYGRPFYKQLFRVLKTGGKIFHYTGQTGRKSGRDIQGETLNRMNEIGFKKLERFKFPGGITGVKQ